MRFVTKFKKFFRKWKISEDHMLIGNVRYKASPNHGGTINTEATPFYIILHYTATVNAKEAIGILCDPNREVSAHLVIDRNGEVTQLVPFNIVAWHAGVSKWKGISSLNNCSIGIEIVNAGKLEKRESAYYTWDNKIISSDETYTHQEPQGELSYWHQYTQTQIKTLLEIIKCLNLYYPVTEILKHSEVSPGRKIDPGPALEILLPPLGNGWYYNR